MLRRLARPRFERRFGVIRPTVRRGREGGASFAVEFQFEVAERRLWGVLERRRDLTRTFVQGNIAR